jgi:HAE1 family hydrophobic/amphiphilic exporter-1
MNLSALCIRRPVMTTLLTAALCVFGAMAYLRLPVNNLPNVDFPTIVVNASLPGATPETMASAVATPLEQQFSTIAGIDSMVSGSSLGSTQITLTFTLSRNIDAAAQDVQAAIASVQRRLPNDMPAPPSLRKTNPADSPILWLTLSSPTLPLSTVDDYAQTRLVQRLSTVEGVAQVQVWGSQKYALRVRLDPRELANRGIALDEIRTARPSTTSTSPPASSTAPARPSPSSPPASSTPPRSSAPSPSPTATAPPSLGEIAEVVDSVQDIRTASWFYKGGSGQRAIILASSASPAPIPSPSPIVSELCCH